MTNLAPEQPRAPLPLVTPLPWRDPWDAAQLLALHRGHDGLVLLDLDQDCAPTSRWAFLGTAPIRELCCRSWPGEGAGEARDPFDLLQQALGDDHGPATAGPSPFMGGWMGWLSYEAGAWVEQRPAWQRPDQPLLWAGLHDPSLSFDRAAQRVWAISHGFTGNGWLRDEALARQRSQTLATLWQQPHPGPARNLTGRQRIHWHWHTSQADFAAQVMAVQELIAAGDIFQANLSCCCEAQLPSPPDPLALYAALRQGSPAPFAGLAVKGENAVVSASPERFLLVEANGSVETRPIKGTRARHQDPIQDASLAVELVSSSKDRSENVMIVDLLRNDLGRVCRSGTVSVPVLAGLETYRSVHHLTSVVTGWLQEHYNCINLLRYAWPGGSVSGAPKVRACERLAALEPLPRGPYCGSLFRLGLDGCFDSSIVIRSIIQKGCRLRAHAGCGIVVDSDPWSEANEMVLKMAPLLQLP